jgi:LysM repeat protein
MTRYRLIFTLLVALTINTAVNAQENSIITHTVNKGQTLYSISKLYNTTVEEIVKMNPESAVTISVGQQLRIPRSTQAKAPKTVIKRNDDGQIYHTIQSGETLYRLGKLYGIAPQEICDANPGLSTSNFRVGETIRIPRIAENAEILANAEKENKTTPVQEEKPQYKHSIKHIVKKNETLESLAQKYNSTPEDILAANPGLENGTLKKNKLVIIPQDKKVNKESDNSKSNNDRTHTGTRNEIPNIKNYNDGVLKVAIVLPFLLDSYAPKEQSRLIEYYQGFLMAVEQLKREGYSFEISTFDAGHKEASLDSLLASGSLDNAELIIGASYSKHSKELAKFAKEREIPLVIPFASKKDEALKNPYVYIANGIQQFILPQVSERFVKTFPNANVVFVEDGENNKKEFVKSLTAELKKNDIPYTTVSLGTITSPDSTICVLSNIYQEEKQMIVIPTSSTPSTLNALLPSLLETKLTDSTRVGKLKLFGYPEWQIHAKDTREMMYEIDTYIYATFYSHYSLPRVAEFQEEYIRWYNCNIQNIYPRYGMLGYDTGYFFLLAASLHGSMMYERINETPFTPVQSDFKFEKIGTDDGYSNNKFFFIHFCPEYWIEKMDFDLEQYQEGYQDENLNEILNDTITPVTDESIY